MIVSVRLSVARSAFAARVLRAAAREWLPKLQYDEVSLSLVADREMRALNRRWRGKDKTTDVLSFPLEETGGARRRGALAEETASPATGGARRRGALAAGNHLGDVVISLDVARRQAREGGWPLKMELRRLLAHGLLHCTGHDHQEPAAAARMRRAEARLLGSRGMV